MNEVTVPIKQNRSFRKKILSAFYYAVLMGIGLSALGAIVIQAGILDKQLQEDMFVQAEIIGNRSIAALVFNDKNTAHKNLKAAGFHEAVELVCMYKQDGSLFSEYLKEQAFHGCASHIAARTTHLKVSSNTFNHFVVSIDIVDGGQYLGTLNIHARKGKVFASVGYFLVMLLIVIGIIVPIIAWRTRLRLDKVMYPLKSLHETAIEISGNTLSGKRGKIVSDDEISELVGVFNTMLDNIAHENKALITSEHRFRALANNAPVGIIQRDKDQSIVYVNDKWTQITGLAGYNTTIQEYEGYIVTDNLEAYQGAWAETMQTGQDLVIEYCFEPTNSDTQKFLLEYTSPLYDSKDALEGYIGTLVDVSELKNVQIELERLALFDPLTNLPNRRYFKEHLNYIIAEAARKGWLVAVLFIDLDDFKKVNDVHGHDVGDELLCAIASRIQKSVYDQDVVSRMGGDEFLILQTAITDNAQVSKICDRILNNISEPLELDGGQVIEITASIGVTFYPTDGNAGTQLVKNADIALYKAKGSGRNRVHFYSEELDNEIKEKVRLEKKLKAALESDRFELYLQPQYSTSKSQIVWAEALLRWNDNGQFISPCLFIPLAEEIGLIEGVGDWVIDNTCDMLVTHAAALKQSGIQGVSINLSGKQFYSKRLIHKLQSITNEYALSADLIEFELTESVFLDDIEMAIDIMRKIRDMGYKLSIDDFGTGYSSLSYLKRFPINTLKIDRSFVSGIPHDKNDVELTAAIIAMAHKLGFEVVAEGVETEEQKQFLIDQGCELLQGYLIDRPKSFQEYIKG